MHWPILRSIALSLLCLLALPGAQAEQTPEEKMATAMLMNRPLLQFRAGLLGATPEQRARRAERNLHEILLQDNTGDITVKPDSLGNSILIGGVQAFFISQQDLDPLANETLDQLTARSIERLRKIRQEFHESRDPDALLKSLLWVLAETFVFGLLVWALLRIRRWLQARLLRLTARHANRLKHVGRDLFGSARLPGMLGGLIKLPYWGLILLLSYTWLGTALSRFAYTRA